MHYVTSYGTGTWREVPTHWCGVNHEHKKEIRLDWIWTNAWEIKNLGGNPWKDEIKLEHRFENLKITWKQTSGTVHEVDSRRNVRPINLWINPFICKRNIHLEVYKNPKEKWSWQPSTWFWCTYIIYKGQLFRIKYRPPTFLLSGRNHWLELWESRQVCH